VVVGVVVVGVVVVGVVVGVVSMGVVVEADAAVVVVAGGVLLVLPQPAARRASSVRVAPARCLVGCLWRVGTGVPPGGRDGSGLFYEGRRARWARRPCCCLWGCCV
jgi:hypothetical protein